MKSFWVSLKRQPYFSTLVVMVVLFIVNAIIQPNFLTLYVLRLNVVSFTALVLVALAQGIVVLQGGVDLSLGAAVTLINVTMASIMGDSMGSVLLALVVGLGVGLATGAFNGLVVGILKLPAIVATFASGAIWSGLALIIMPAPGGNVPRFFYSLYQQDILGFIPVPLFLIIIAALVWLFLQRRRFVRHLYAVGGSEQAAYASWIKVRSVRIRAYLLCGLFTSLAAVMVTMQSASGDPNLGQPFTLSSVAAVVVGGISLYGGKGKLFGAAMGAIIFGLLTNIIFFARISSFYQDLIRGLIIILALALSLLPQLRRRARTEA